MCMQESGCQVYRQCMHASSNNDTFKKKNFQSQKRNGEAHIVELPTSPPPSCSLRADNKEEETCTQQSGCQVHRQSMHACIQQQSYNYSGSKKEL